MFEIAYTKLHSKPGNMTNSINPLTIDGISYEWLDNMIEFLRNESFRFSLGRKVNMISF